MNMSKIDPEDISEAFITLSNAAHDHKYKSVTIEHVLANGCKCGQCFELAALAIDDDGNKIELGRGDNAKDFLTSLAEWDE